MIFKRNCQKNGKHTIKDTIKTKYKSIKWPIETIKFMKNINQKNSIIAPNPDKIIFITRTYSSKKEVFFT